MNFIRCAAVGVGLVAMTPFVQAVDSSLGKPAYSIARAAAPLPVWNLDSHRGKTPYEEIVATQPPRGPGPGLRFNTRRVFYVYSDRGAGANHFIPSGWMGDYGDLIINDASLFDPADGRTSFKIHYLAKGSQNNDWAGMYWQDPVDNWGQKSGGYDLRGMTRLTFWARGEQGNERISVFKVGGIRGDYADSDAAEIGPIYLDKTWTQYAIDLKDVDLSRVSGGFAWATGRYDNAGPIAFYIDEIRYER